MGDKAENNTIYERQYFSIFKLPDILRQKARPFERAILHKNIEPRESGRNDLIKLAENVDDKLSGSYFEQIGLEPLKTHNARIRAMVDSQGWGTPTYSDVNHICQVGQILKQFLEIDFL